MEPGPWSTIWRNPRQTIQNIIDNKPNHHFYLLVILGGISQTLGNAPAMSEMLPHSMLLGFSIFSGPLIGLFSIYLGGYLIYRVAKWLGGIATYEQTRIAIAWSWAPFVYTLPLWGVKYILFRDEMFLLERPFVESQPLLNGLYDLFTMVDFAVFVVYLYILFVGLSQINRFSIVKSVGSWIIVGIFLGIITLLLLQFVGPGLPG